MARIPAPRLPAPLTAVLRSLGIPVQETARYWQQESTALWRGIVALFLAAIADLGAGIILGAFDTRVQEIPGLLVLIPAAIAMRGATFGALGARLGTAIHTGLFEPELRPGTYLWRQIEAAGVLTMVTSVEAAVLAKLFSAALGMRAVPLWDLVIISVLGGVLASLILLVVTVVLARAAYAREWNMDDVGAPAITATGDLVTIPALLLSALLSARGAVTLSIAVVLIAFTLATLAYGWLHPLPEIRRLVRESVVVLTAAAAVSIMAGLVIEGRSDIFLSTPTLLVLFPAFVAMFGSLGGILSSRLTSKLHLGAIEPRVLPGKMAALDFTVTYLLALIIFAFIGVAGWLAATVIGLSPPSMLTLVSVMVLGGIIGTAFLTIVAYTAATATYRFGLDPDNHAIPIVTSVMDFVGMLCLVGALAVVGVG